MIFSSDVPEAPQPISFLHIPPELVLRILLYLTPHDIISCRCTCRMLYDLCSSPALHYLIQLERCAVNDDMRPGLGYLERLRILENREVAWATLDFRKSVQLSVPFDLTSTYDLTGGALILGTRPSYANHQPTVGYSYVRLPSLWDSQDQNLEWKGIGLDTEMLDFGLAAYEYDLIAILTAKADIYRQSEQKAILEIRFLSFSTSQPHPLAKQPITFIATKALPLDISSLHFEIVGDSLVLLTTFGEGSENEDMFILVSWKKGKTHSLLSPEWGTYIYFNFLSEDTLMVPSLIHNTLEVVKIVIDSDDTPRLVPLCVLHLPPLTQGASLQNLYSRSEPNPTGSGSDTMSSPSGRPFHDKAEDAIIIFDISYRYYSGGDWLTFIVHRRALLAHIPAVYRTSAPFCSALDPMPAPVQVPWPTWGPPATRWFKGEHASTGWITRTAGQRAVTLGESIPTPIKVRDFNPYAVRAAFALAAASVNGQSNHRNWSKQLPNGNQMTLNVEESIFTADYIFKEDVRSSLPYVEVVTQNEYYYLSIMVDDQRILGLKSCGVGNRSWSFDVHVLG